MKRADDVRCVAGILVGSRSLQNLLTTARVAALDLVPQEQQMLMNLNTPEDYNRLFHRV